MRLAIADPRRDCYSHHVAVTDTVSYSVRVRVADTSSVRVTDANGLCVADCDSHANININTNANANGDRHTNTYPVCKLRGPAHVSGGAGITGTGCRRVRRTGVSWAAGLS